jgi:hypothetical protein
MLVAHRKDSPVKRSALVPAVLVVALSLSGCTSLSLTQIWRDPNYGSRPVKRVFVLSAMPKSANPAQFENALAAAITAKGFEAATASSVFQPGTRLDKLKVKKYVEDNGVDLLIMVHLTTEPAKPVVVTTTVVQGSGWYGGYGAVGSQSTVISQGTDMMARVDVFDVRTEPDTGIWSGQSNTVDIQGAAQQLAAQIVKDLLDARILVK